MHASADGFPCSRPGVENQATGAVRRCDDRRMPDTAKGPEISLVTREGAPDLLAVDQWAFGFDPALYGEPEQPDGQVEVLDTLEWDRTYGAWLDQPHRLAGIYSVHSVRCPLPGGTSTPAGALTWVGVHPRDRRRGVLTALIGHHLDGAERAGEPISLLFASEPVIYQRFGYGQASRCVTLELGRGIELRDVPGADDLVVDFDLADPDRWTARLAACYRAARAGRPGWVGRDGAALERYALHDPPARRKGAEPLRVLTVSTPEGDLRGYALFRRRPKWTDGVPAGTVLVTEAVALDGAASRALWGRLTDLDLTTTVETPVLPEDDPLVRLTLDPRTAAPRTWDGLWLRLIDVPAALAARRYQVPVDAVIEVRDAGRPVNSGRWRLTGDPDGAECVATSDPAQVELDVRDLASTYLGGTTWTSLVGAGLVTVRDAAAPAALSVAFASPVAPYCGWEF
jgi:predicted acetyltransferase